MSTNRRDAGLLVDQPRVDLISDVLRSIRLSGTLYFEAELAAPWCIEIGSTGFANFHFVTEGACWLRIDGGDWSVLNEGDTVVFPHGATHALCDRPGVDGVDGTSLFNRVDDDGVVRLGGDGAATTIICGHFSYDRQLSHPLLHALPNVLHGRAIDHPGWTTLSELAVSRSKRLAPGAQALTDRLAEVLLIEVLSELDPARARFLHAMADPTVGAALHAIHENPAQGWTVVSLATHVAASRSTLASRFTELVGESPIRYLTRWRMHQAACLLRDTTLPTSRIAELVGYSTPFSFTKAFAREVGVAPTTYRTQ